MKDLDLEYSLNIDEFKKDYLRNLVHTEFSVKK